MIMAPGMDSYYISHLLRPDLWINWKSVGIGRRRDRMVCLLFSGLGEVLCLPIQNRSVWQGQGFDLKKKHDRLTLESRGHESTIACAFVILAVITGAIVDTERHDA
jgi:hypothetical protein